MKEKNVRDWILVIGKENWKCFFMGIYITYENVVFVA